MLSLSVSLLLGRAVRTGREEAILGCAISAERAFDLISRGKELYDKTYQSTSTPLIIITHRIGSSYLH